MTPQQQQAAWDYVTHIRNKHKRAYGMAYLRFLLEYDPEPERPGELSVMGAQAVRHRLYFITRPTEDEYAAKH